MKVVVKDFLNVRVGAPQLDAPCYQYLAPGSEIEVLDELVSGHAYEGISTWLVDAARNYYWSGGVHPFQIPLPQRVPEARSWEEAVNTYPGKGTSVGVAILDSGVYLPHAVIGPRIKYFESFLYGNSKTILSSHGHRVAGILGAEKDPVRNQSDLFMFLVSKDVHVDSYAVELALLEIDAKPQLFPGLRLINLSLEIQPSYVARLQPIIDKLYAKGILLVVAAGQDGAPTVMYSLKNVVKVATFDPSNTATYRRHGFPLKDCIYFLNYPIPTFGKTDTQPDSSIQDDSAYCAFMTSLLARRLELSSNENLFDYTRHISSPIRSVSEVHPFTPYLI
ncbi:MAG: S8/S53 family peptidase [Cytophagaceae bacterium]|jgi:subtilisin family serine protease|nr:S8/S53 family peptidase [Cytophagaceae bacterium]